MKKYRLRCTKCGSINNNLMSDKCDLCGGILLIDYNSSELKESIDKMIEHYNKFKKIDYKFVIPEIQKENIVSLGEGNTPYIEALNLSENIGLDYLYLKDETQNPTGSFKDRAVSLCMSVAKNQGSKEVVIASSGNGGASSAAYGARAGMKTKIIVPETTPREKIVYADMCGADVIREPGKFDKSFEKAKKLSKDLNIMNLTTTFQSPIGVEGYKIIAYEIFLESNELPKYIFIPVGAGPILYGIYKGFNELKNAKKINYIPKLIAVQSEGCSPIVRAINSGNKTKAWDNPSGIASAISDPLKGYEDNGDMVVEAVINTDGFGISVNDEETINAGRKLARTEGVFVEPSSATALAALLKAKKLNLVKKTDNVALILTGTGLKDSSKYL